MRYVQLRAFHHVAVCGGFSRAAEALSLTQPAISDQVRKLEEDYDVVLFNRSKKQVSLTDAGRHLLDVTHRLFEAERQAFELLSESSALRTGSLRIIADSAHHLLHMLGAFRDKFPAIKVSIRSGNTEDVTAQLYNYEADIGVAGGTPAGRDFETVKLGSTPLIAFVSDRHPLAVRRSVTLADLAGQTLVLRERGSKTRHSIEAAAAERGLTLQAAIEAEGREAVREIVATGAGVGVVSAAEFGHDDRLVPIEVSDCDARMDEALICLRERGGGKLISAFFQIARNWHPATD